MTYLTLYPTLRSHAISTRLPAFRPLWSAFDALETILDDLDLPSEHRIQSDEETDTAYTFSVPLPGFKKDEVAIEVSQEGVLSVTASKGGGKVEGTKSTSGSLYSRSITLPYDSDLDKVEAKMEDGLLTVTVAKQAKPVPRKVAVS